MANALIKDQEAKMKRTRGEDQTWWGRPQHDGDKGSLQSLKTTVTTWATANPQIQATKLLRGGEGKGILDLIFGDFCLSLVLIDIW